MPSDVFIQYGCFAILAAIVGWSLRWGIPYILEVHKQTMEGLVKAFEKEQGECRGERLSLAASNAVERDKDRDFREQWMATLNDTLLRLGTSIEHIAPENESPLTPKGTV